MSESDIYCSVTSSHDLGPAYFRRRDAALDRIEELAAELADLAADVWCLGDGYGGAVKDIIAASLAHLPEAPPVVSMGPRSPNKKEISNALRTAVFERDAYRCLACGSHMQLRADHVIPESKGGPTTLENLQTLCMPCNSAKGTRFIDYRTGEVCV